MKLTLVNFQSEEEIDLDAKDPVIIGRGSLFGCLDKKVSRNHGQIQLALDGKVHLTALHTNPCFFMKNGLPPVHQLAKDEEKILNDGDYFGLLPDSFWYKIVVKNNDSENGVEVIGSSSNDLNIKCQPFKDCKTEENVNQIGSEEVEGDAKCVQSSECDISKLTAAGDESAKSTRRDAEPSNAEDLIKKSEQLNSSDSCWLTERLKALEKTKKLPLSMYEIDDFPGQFEQVNFQEESHCLLEDNETQPTEKGNNIEGDLTTDTTSADASMHNIYLATSGKNASQEDSKANQKIEESDNFVHGSRASTSEVKSSDNNEIKTMDLHSAISQKRPICQYEEKCCRKNKQHQREFCHPGDADFIPYSNRPQCRYGASCYRQNKSHRVEYQHPQSKKQKENSPADSPKRKRPKRMEKTYYDSFEEDDYDLEDPFANCGSSDEYIPSDLDSDDDTDDLKSESASVSTPI